jgi:DNA-binding response OmpR family regulator
VLIDLANRLVLVDGEWAELTPKEFDILAVLARYPGVVVPRDRIIREVWGTDWSGFGRSLEVHVGSIRRKLARPSLIATLRGVGYRLTGS